MLAKVFTSAVVGLDVFEDARIPYAFLPFAVRSVVVQVAKLADKSTFPDAGPPDDRNAHTLRIV